MLLRFYLAGGDSSSDKNRHIQLIIDFYFKRGIL
jgi:hypothetical protein